MPKKTPEQIRDLFVYHQPTEVARQFHRLVTEHSIEMAEFLNTLPECREVSLAFTHLEEVRTWANAAIARNHDKLE